MRKTILIDLTDSAFENFGTGVVIEHRGGVTGGFGRIIPITDVDNGWMLANESVLGHLNEIDAAIESGEIPEWLLNTAITGGSDQSNHQVQCTACGMWYDNPVGHYNTCSGI